MAVGADPSESVLLNYVEIPADKPKVAFGLVQALPPPGSEGVPVLILYAKPQDIAYQAARPGWRIVRAYIGICDVGVDLGTTIEPLDRIFELAEPSADNIAFMFVTASGRNFLCVHMGSVDADTPYREIYRFTPPAGS